ncbi:hypothetical protein HN51_055925, partial [Arachis hypogaea]
VESPSALKVRGAAEVLIDSERVSIFTNPSPSTSNGAQQRRTASCLHLPAMQSDQNS